MFEEDKLIGHYAASPIELIIDGEKIKTALSMTTMTDPEFGGKGIFSKLASSLYREMEDVLNFLEKSLVKNTFMLFKKKY